MDFVLDANILFSSLIKNSITAKLIFEEDIVLFAPEFLLEEFTKYKTEIQTKTKRPKDELEIIFELLSSRIKFIPKEDLKPFLPEAERIAPDPKDVPYFAAAMKVGAKIWSNDKKLREQNKVKVVATHELLRFLKPF